MRENLGEPLTVDDMARAAMFSKFHFTRVFQRVTGVSPGRFLSALRLEQAKHLLISTSLNVADISVRVGYNSVGTFSSRFSRSVGMSPTAFRRQGGFAAYTPPALEPSPRQPSGVRLSGHVYHPQPDDAGVVFLGLFPERIPEGRPIRCAILPRPGSYQLDDVSPGRWYLSAQSIARDYVRPAHAVDGADRAVMVATAGPLTIDSEAMEADLHLMPVRALDPPVLLAMVDARTVAFSVPETSEPALRSIA